jgi:predicted RNase H-like nuclease (RuvC/YqgF family)
MKIKKEQLETIQKQQQELNAKLQSLGYLEAQKHGILHDLAALNKDIEDFKTKLEEEYGPVNINLEDGSYEKIEKEEVVENV